MKHRLHTIHCWMVVLLFSAIPGYAVKSISTPLQFSRPDGTRVAVRLYGDEFFSYKKDAEGYLVEVGQDGFLYYADYQMDGIRLSRTRTKAPPHALLASLRERNIQQRRGLLPGGRTKLPQRASIGRLSMPQQVKTPVLLVEFSDVKFTIASPVKQFDNQLNQSGYYLNGATGSAADYFNENLNGRYFFTFEVQPEIIRLKKPQAYYAADGTSGVDERIGELYQDVSAAAREAGLNLLEYDWAGEGKIRYIALIYAGTSQAETGQPNDIWPQYQDVSHLSHQGLAIQAFGCSSELSVLPGLQGQMSGIGTFCHEFAHSLGLPDLYDTNGEVEGWSTGMHGDFSLMDSGNFLNAGRTPPYLTAIEQEILGYPVSIPVPGNQYELTPIWNGGNIIRIDSDNPGEYFLIECRHQAGWDAYIQGGGMMVYHVDKSERVYGGIPSALRWQYNNVNTMQKHPCARIFAPFSEGKENLFFPGVAGHTQLSSYGKPRFADWADKPLSIHLSGISYDKKTVQFNAIIGQIQNLSLPHAISYRASPYQYDSRITWSSSDKELISGGKWRVRWRPIVEQKESPVWENVFTSETECYLYYLLPATEYEVAIVFEKENHYGEEITLRLNTQSITSLLPYIQGKGLYATGEILDLRVLNLTQGYEQVSWFVNGKEQKGTRLLFNSAGVYTLRAKILYKDGTDEFIIKKIKVN